MDFIFFFPHNIFLLIFLKKLVKILHKKNLANNRTLKKMPNLSLLKYQIKKLKKLFSKLCKLIIYNIL